MLVQLYIVRIYDQTPDSTVKTKFIDPVTQADDIKVNMGLHERIKKDSIISLNIDIDYLDEDINIILQKIIDYLNTYNLSCSLDDIKYTQNFGKINKKTNKIVQSYHIVIPKFHAVSSLQKVFWMKFISIYGYNKIVDYGHLGIAKRYFRLPYQLKDNVKNTEHIIQRGEIKNFILHYIHDDSICIDNHISSHNSNTINKKEKIKINIPNIPTSKLYNEKNILKLINHTNWEVIHLLLLLPNDFIHDYETWILTGIFCYCLLDTDTGYIVWNELSKKSDKYEPDCCASSYKCFSHKSKTIGGLYLKVKELNPEGYKEFILKRNYIKIIGMNNFQTYKFHLRYITEKNINDWANISELTSETFKIGKVLCIKSPMDTGKTTFIEHIFNNFTSEKTLFITYRRSLAYNLETRFKDYQVENYLNVDGTNNDKIFNSDKLIIQLESLLKLDSNEDNSEVRYYSETKIKSYDLIVIDEIVSLLNQFSSPTMKGKAREIYEYLCALMSNCDTRVILMDADYNNRSHNFINGIFPEDKINVLENTYNKNTKTIRITKYRTVFEKDILEHLKNNKRIVICSMSSKEACYYNDKIKADFPDKKVYLYHGLSDDTYKREHFKNVEKFWRESDIIIYTSVIEGGVDFNMEHFDKIYVVLLEETCSQRSVYQMINRVRKTTDDEILCFNSSSMTMNNNWFWTYDEVIKHEEHLKEFYKTNYQKINGQIVKKQELVIDEFEKILIHNKVETLNKIKSYFLPYFVEHGKNKGYTIIFDEDVETDQKTFQSNIKKTDIIDMILQTNDITYVEYERLNNKQLNAKNTLSEYQKLSIEKYYYKNLLGVRNINRELLSKFYKKDYLLKNFSGLLDLKNIDEKDTETFNKVKIGESLIKDLGFTGLFDEKKQSFIDFRKNLEYCVKNNFAFTSYKETRCLFLKNKGKCEKKDFLKDSKTIGYTIQYINEILKYFGVEVKNIQPKGKHKNENYLYEIKVDNDIREIIQNKLEKSLLNDELKKFKIVDKYTLIFNDDYTSIMYGMR